MTLRPYQETIIKEARALMYGGCKSLVIQAATGSGKTLLMGATILDLWHKGYKDFLILTPNTILFDKTIENFTPRAVKSIFGDGWNLTYNLVTGNSYRDKTCNWEDDRDISFYVFYTTCKVLQAIL